MNNLELYEKVRQVPPEAQKEIIGGRLRGKTDINPMWRIKTLTEQFGPCGIGWWPVIKDKRIEDGANGEKAAFVDIDFYYVVDGKVSQPIAATGGSSLVSKEEKGLYTNDEAYKMALTDAISVACKFLGFGADIYWQDDKTKYSNKDEPKIGKPPQEPKKTTAPQVFICGVCKNIITEEENSFSVKHYGKSLCRKCQKNHQRIKS